VKFAPRAGNGSCTATVDVEEVMEAALEHLLRLGDVVQDVFQGGGTFRQRRFSRILVGIVFALNLSVFLGNLRWLILKEQLLQGVVKSKNDEAVEIEYPPVFNVEEQFGKSKYFPFLQRSSKEFQRDTVARPIPGTFTNRSPRIISLISTEIITAIRNLVGSIHWWHPDMKITLYQIGPVTVRHQSEIELWDNVEVVPVKSVIAPLCLDPELRFDSGPFYTLRKSMEAQEAAGQSSVLLEPDLDLVLREVKSLQPLVMYHATKEYGSILFLDPSAYASGWIDNVFKSLLRDGFFFVQDQSVSGGCLSEVQGYEWNSTSLKQILVPHVLCASGAHCPSATTLLSELPSVRTWWGLRPDDVFGFSCHSSMMAKLAVEESFKVEEASNNVDWMHEKYSQSNSGGDMPKFDCRLSIMKTEPTLGFETKIKASSAVHQKTNSDENAKAMQLSNNSTADYLAGIIHVAIGIPSTTIGTQLVAPDSLPLLNLFLPSFLSTIDRQTKHFRYTIYIGYDLGDVVYDENKKRDQARRRMSTMIGDYPVAVKALRFPVSLSTTYVWNGLFDTAMGDGADYFMACHDDTEFYPLSGKYWTDVLVDSLAKNALWPNFGVAGPLDMRNPKLISHPFVHKTHKDIFKSLYPPTLSNSEHDDWISRVYGYKNTFLHTGVQVYNTHRFTGRGKPCVSGASSVPRAIELGLMDLRTWLNHQLGQYSNEHILSTMLE